MSAAGTPEVEIAPTPELGSKHIPSTTAPSQQQQPTKRKKRLANDHIGQLEDHLQDNPLDLAAWIDLIGKVEAKDKIEQVRSVYEDYLSKFPFRYSEWIKYITYELQRDNFEKVENIFRKCLFNSSSIPLWKLYISYVFRKNNLITGGEDSRRNIFQAYDIAIEQVGFDPNSISLWEEYLTFIESWKPINNWDSQQKMDLKRKIYQKLLKIPIDGLEKLWNDYTEFENSLNSTTARKFIGETSPGYMNARSCLKEINNLTLGLVRSVELPSKEIDQEQLHKWQAWIHWEMQNKLELNENQLVQRIEYFFQNSLQILSFSSELWFEFINYLESTHGLNNEKIDDVLKMSLNILPGSILINLKIVEIYELRNEMVLVSGVFNKLIEYYQKQFNNVEMEIENVKKDVLGDEEDEENSRSEETKAELLKGSTAIESKNQELKKLSKIITLIYVEWFKSTKRQSGMKEARQIFSLSRNNRKTLTHHIFHQVAIIESQATSQKTSIKVFELGLKPTYFNKDGEYIYKYLNFLIEINDDNNLKTVFETTINTKIDDIEPVWIKLIFKKFIRYELKFGNMNNVSKLKKKYFDKFPQDDRVEFFADLYKAQDQLVQIDDDLIRLVDVPKSEIEEEPSTKKRSSEGVNGTEELEDGNKRIQLNPITPDVEPQSTEHDSKQFVSDEVYNLLRVLPNSGNFPQPIVDNHKLILLLNKIE